MRAAAEDPALGATDLAEELVRGGACRSASAHEVVGRLVRRAEEKRVSLRDLVGGGSARRRRRADARKSCRRSIRPRAVAARSLIGGPAPAAVAARSRASRTSCAPSDTNRERGFAHPSSRGPTGRSSIGVRGSRFTRRAVVFSNLPPRRLSTMATLIRRNQSEVAPSTRTVWDPFRVMRDVLRWDPFRELEATAAGDYRAFSPELRREGEQGRLCVPRRPAGRSARRIWTSR